MTAAFHQMTDEELVEFCRGLYLKGGISALSFVALKAHRTLYTTLYHRDLRLAVLFERLGLVEEYRAWKAVEPVRHGSEIRQRWTWDRIVKEAKEVQQAEGFLPPAAWWQSNGRGSLVAAVYLLRRTWEDLRVELGDFRSSQFIESRSGLRWRSHAEASLSNYLYARGVQHRRGERYPEAYEELTGRAYGMYDLHFNGLSGPVDIEIWGDNPKGSGRDHYQTKQQDKEEFNKDNPSFLGIYFMDCYNEKKLDVILEKQIGSIAPFQFDLPTDKILPSTHWSNADELLAYCREFARAQPNGDFPTEEWLRKRGKWSERPGPAYNTLSVYVKTWLGGVRKLRELLGQAHVSTVKWDREKVLERWKAFRELHGITPSAMRARSARGQGVYPADALVEAGLLVAVVPKYVGGSEAADLATGFTPNRRKPRRKK